MEIVAIARTPASSGPPTLTEVGPFTTPSDIKLTEALTPPHQLTFTVPARIQEPEVADRFLDLAADATEIAVWLDDGTLAFQGPLVGYAPSLAGDDLAWAITAQSLYAYVRRFRIEPDDEVTYTNTDQALIASGLIDYWQALPYGDYGIDTAGVAATGVLRDRTYPALEVHNIAQRIEELAAVDDGFDFDVDHATRDLEVYYPERGVDRTDTIQIDARNIVDPSAQLSAAAEDLISEAYAVGDDGRTSHRFDTAIRAAVGRVGFGSKFSGVTQQATLVAHADRMLAERSSQLHIPPSAIYPTTFDWTDFGLGDLVEFAYDYGAGTVLENRRVGTRTLSITAAGAAALNVGLL